MSFSNSVRRAAAYHLARPLIRRELPGWGRLFDLFVGNWRKDALWKGAGTRWVRGKLHGYEMRVDLSGWSNRMTYFLGRFYDLETQTLVRAVLKPGDTFVDIGANEGMISLIAAERVGPGGKVIAFEPNPRPRAALEAAIARNGIGHIDLRAMGLSDAPATLDLSVPKVNSGEGSFGRSAYRDEDVERIQCPVEVGDAVLAGEQPRLIKIDVEGFEEHVLCGLAETIRRARPLLITEVVSRHLQNADSTPEALLAIMEGHGYSGWRLGLTRDGRSHRLTLSPVAFTPDYHDDVLWAHRDDPQLPELLARFPDRTTSPRR